MARFFVNSCNKKDNLIFIDGDENTHLNSVLRLKVGEQVDICFNNGLVYTCELVEVGKKQSIAQIFKISEEQNLGHINLFMALINADRMDWLVQKVTELGVSCITPFESEFCTVKDKGNKAERLRRVALSACKQSRRAFVPEIKETLSFNQMIGQLEDFEQVIIAYENEKQNAKEILSKLDKTKPIAIVIGSEGGFSKKEVEILKEKGNCISLGRSILRAETAGMALISAINYELGFWEKK